MINSSAAGMGSALAPRQNPLDAAHSTLEHARDLVYRVEALANRLVGSVPEPCEASATKRAVDPSALLDALHEHAEVVANRLNDGMRALDRIEARL